MHMFRLMMIERPTIGQLNLSVYVASESRGRGVVALLL